MIDALILFGHGARDPRWAAPIEQIRDSVRTLRPSLRVEAAFLEYLSPSLEVCVEGLVVNGCRDLVILPMFIAHGGHLKSQVPAMLVALRLRYPGVRISLAGAIGEAPAVIAAMADHAVTLLRS